MKIWLDGQLVDRAEASLSVFDHGTLYGDGVFEGIRVYSGKIFECQAHMDRLFQSAEKIRLTIPYSREQIIAAMESTMAANKVKDGYIRLVVTRGAGTLGLNPYRCPKASVFVIADQLEMYPAEMYERGMPVIIAKTRRTNATMLDPAVKSLNYLNNIMARVEAVDAGVGEAIMLNDRGEVAEATGDNLFIVKNGTVLTPPVSAGILQGVTRRVTPCRMPALTGGVSTVPFLTMNKLSPVASATSPRSLSMIASPTPASTASTRAMMLLR